MKTKIRNSALKRAKSVGFMSRKKTPGGRRVIKRRIRKSGKFRVK
ncbi:MAG: 50S ribosomal protein L34 [Planctomycetes bacterium]|nr:50S ribosomal protein L34 [Planctomycetota bacterium]